MCATYQKEHRTDCACKRAEKSGTVCGSSYQMQLKSLLRQTESLPTDQALKQGEQKESCFFSSVKTAFCRAPYREKKTRHNVASPNKERFTGRFYCKIRKAQNKRQPSSEQPMQPSIHRLQSTLCNPIFQTCQQKAKFFRKNDEKNERHLLLSSASSYNN